MSKVVGDVISDNFCLKNSPQKPPKGGGGAVKNENSIRNWHKNGWPHFYKISYLVQMSKIN